jgi:hypothetical protein
MKAGDWFFGQVLHMGANWRVTISGIGGAFFELLTLLSGASYALGDIAIVIPASVKAKIFTASLTAQIILKVWNAFSQKSRNVTGGNTQQTLQGNVVQTGNQSLVDLTSEASKLQGEATPTIPSARDPLKP